MPYKKNLWEVGQVVTPLPENFASPGKCFDSLQFVGYRPGGFQIKNTTMKINSSFRNAVILGIISGMRTGASLHYTRCLVEKSEAHTGLVRFFQKKHATPGIGLLAIAELVVDKLPQTPDRTAKGGPFIKAGTAAISGAAIYQANGKNAITGALVGGLVALASTYLFFNMRKTVSNKTGVKDPLIGIVEDTLAIATGMALVKANKAIV